MRGGLESLAKCAMAASTDSKISGGLPVRRTVAAAYVALHAAVDDDEAREPVREAGGKGHGEPPRGGVSDHDRLVPVERADDREDVAHVGIDRVVLARAPAGLAEAALVEAGDLAIGGEGLGDADPVVGIEIVGAVHQQNRRRPARAKGAIEDRDVTRIHPSIALHGASPVLAARDRRRDYTKGGRGTHWVLCSACGR